LTVFLHVNKKEKQIIFYLFTSSRKEEESLWIV
jgi:hypothetical protein